MPDDLTAKLAASLPGAPTKWLDYASVSIAVENMRLAIAQLQAARSRFGVIVGPDRPALHQLDAALLEARRAHADAEIILRALAR